MFGQQSAGGGCVLSVVEPCGISVCGGRHRRFRCTYWSLGLDVFSWGSGLQGVLCCRVCSCSFFRHKDDNWIYNSMIHHNRLVASYVRKMSVSSIYFHCVVATIMVLTESLKNEVRFFVASRQCGGGKNRVLFCTDNPINKNLQNLKLNFFVERLDTA